MKIMLDPGHGGTDAGAVAKDGTREADIVLNIALFMRDALRAIGDTVYMTRHADVYKTLQDRCDQEIIHSPKCFVSLHCNAFTNHSAHGIEVWTTPGQTAADPLAEAVLDSMKAHFQSMIFRSDFEDGDADREKQLYVLRHTVSPAILVEMGFVSNDQECKWLKNIETQKLLAMSIGSGILAWHANK